MKPFAIIGLLVPIIVGGWWFISTWDTTVDETDVEVVTTNDEVVELGREAVEKIAEVTQVGESVFVYDGISIPSGATKLDLSGRGLTGSLKAEIRQLSELHELDISNNKFTGLPAEVGQLSQLERLDLSNNPLTGLPHEIGNLQNLQVLDLRGTQYSAYDLDIIKAGLPASVQILTN